MIVYSKHFFRRKRKSVPRPNVLVLAIFFALLSALIVFILPPARTGVNVRIPELNTQVLEIDEDYDYASVYLTKDGLIYFNNKQIDDGGLISILSQQFSNNKDVKIFIYADKEIDYGYIVYLLRILNDNGYKNIALVGKYMQNDK